MKIWDSLPKKQYLSLVPWAWVQLESADPPGPFPFIAGVAPEVVASGYTSKQSDLYQTGLLMYWMLTGEPAIGQNLPYQELVRIVGEGLPRKKAEAIGTPLGGLVAKMLRRRDAYRYTSAREVWADLRQLPSWQNRELFPVK